MGYGKTTLESVKFMTLKKCAAMLPGKGCRDRGRTPVYECSASKLKTDFLVGGLGLGTINDEMHRPTYRFGHCIEIYDTGLSVCQLYEALWLTSKRQRTQKMHQKDLFAVRTSKNYRRTHMHKRLEVRLKPTPKTVTKGRKERRKKPKLIISHVAVAIPRPV
eukprot:scaffold5376_cov171-Amphora_coffeaeformis.AAC.11